MTQHIGILLTNIGSPDQPTPSSVRCYLKKFLSDPRVVEIPRIMWWPILYGLILPFRPQRSAKLYQQIWTEQGSPLLYYSDQLTQQLKTELNLPIELGTHYGNPSIQTALEKLRIQQVKKILIFPLYPQYSATTTAVTFDQVTTELKKWRKIPEIRTIHHYADDENYIAALSQSIKKYPVKNLLFSFHGLPKRFVEQGDPYYDQCQTTANLIAEKLKLTKEKWSMTFQSRLGRAEWLQPYTDQYLKSLPQRGVTDVHVVCPGFAVDCLETLEEIAIRGKKQFFNAGGNSFEYIPALNNSDEHRELLKKIILQNIKGW